eukprot:11185063-Lingulodinium_polyedra.AAC.1
MLFNPSEEAFDDGPSPDALSGVRVTQKTSKDGTHDNVVNNWMANKFRHPTVKFWIGVSVFFPRRDETTSVV